jgi:GT2 family glycosyltransferase
MVQKIKMNQILASQFQQPASPQELWPPTRHGQWMKPEHQASLVSVILPTFNRARLLRDALDSVKSQSYRPIELLVIDDGSTDNTRAVYENWAESIQHTERLDARYLCQPNYGAPAARNLGLIHSRGEYIQYLDSDDILHPEKIRLQRAAFENNRAFGYIFSDFETFHDSDHLTPQRTALKDRLIEATPVIRPRIFTSVWIGLLTRSAARNIGPWKEDLAFWQDVEYNSRIAAAGLLCGTIPEPLYYMRHHQGPERIHRLKQSMKSIDHALTALEQCERNIQAARLPASAEYDLSTCYYRVVGMTFKHGSRSQVEKCSRLMDQFHPQWSFTKRVRPLLKLQRFLGIRAGAYLYDAYAYFKTGKRLESGF